ncbi:MAG: sensor histidine kinase, partial [Methylocella sp.]
TDRLRSALLTSISHDLRTPLASILGSATSLISHGCELDKTVQASLLRTIQEEAERLNRFIGNLLDMTRLESGALTPQNGPVDLSDVIGATVQRASKILRNHQVEIALEPNIPMVKADMVLLEQVLFNLFDNAAKYAPLGSRIDVAAARKNGFVAVRVLDEGDGIPEADLERVFDKFYRVRRGDRQRAGAGLGLAICRGFVEAMGGRLTVANQAARKGAVFTITLPASGTPLPPGTLP